MELRDEFILKAQDYFDKYDAGKVIVFDEEYNRYKKKGARIMGQDIF